MRKETIFVLFMLIFSSFAIAGPLDLSNGLISYWELDDGNGTTANDSADSNHGSLANMDPPSDWVNGIVNGGLDFDGLNDYVNVSHSSNLHLGTGNFTISLWINTSDTSRHSYLSKRGDGGKLGWFFGSQSQDTMIFYCYTCSNRDSYSNSVALRDGLWHHVAVVRAGDNITFYHDGLPARTSTNVDANFVHGYPLRIGHDEGLAGEFKGVMDDVAIWNRSLNASEISSLYSSYSEEGVIPEIKGTVVLQIFVLLISALLIGALLFRKN